MSEMTPDNPEFPEFFAFLATIPERFPPRQNHETQQEAHGWTGFGKRFANMSSAAVLFRLTRTWRSSRVV